MAESVLDRVGWDPAEFELFRCTLEYPLFSSTVRVRFELPQRGNW